MPRKSMKGRKQCWDEIKNRTKRLVQISLRADDLIYNKKPIPLHEARQYLEELTHYKSNTLDARSRQVAEKLIIVMKDILQEEYESTVLGQVNITQNVPSIQNPLLIETPKIHEATGQTEVNLKLNSGPSRNEVKDTITIPEYPKENIIIDLCEDNDETIRAIEKLNDKEVSDETAISNLNINEIDDFLTDCHLKEHNIFSQSILMDFDDNACSQSFEQFSEPAIMLHQDLTPLKQRILKRVTPKVTKSNVFTQDGAVNSFKLGKQDNLTSVEETQAFLPKESNKQEAVRRTPRKQQVNSLCNSIECVKFNTAITKRRRRSKVTCHEIEQTNAFKDANKNLKLNENVTKTNQKTQTGRKRKRKNVVVEDLSWVENLKFVRVIDNDEFDPSEEYGENFWNNLYYPQNWDNLGFS